MITGDNKQAAFKVANSLGILEWNVLYRAWPEDKRSKVEDLQSTGWKVMFVGDGINDSPVLAQADIGVAINAKNHMPVDAAGVVLLKNSLLDVIDTIWISWKAFWRIKINYLWAFLYNVVLIPIAMGVLYPLNHWQLNPELAAVAMAMSSISVVISSLMLKTFTPTKLDQNKRSSKKAVGDLQETLLED